MLYLIAKDFTEWRGQARDMLARQVLPLEVTWVDSVQASLFEDVRLPRAGNYPSTVPADFLPFAKAISFHRDARRWDLLYQLLWRLTHGEKHLLHITTDPLMIALLMMEKAVRRDAHKMKAFVRFRRVQDDEGEYFIAWHRPDHCIVRKVAPFFARRFETMRWTILTPDESVSWQGEELVYGPGVGEEAAPKDDAIEDMWRTYYRATFNPARIKIKAMKKEMPVRHWHTLPETDIIADMLEEVPSRVEAMLKHTEGAIRSAEDYLPAVRDLYHLTEAAKKCEGCELHRAATRTVFGEGSFTAKLMIVGEQPGDEEDKQGRAFAGPAGALLDEMLTSVGLVREDIYITNAVKHFRFFYHESFRQHQSPSPHHVRACKPWLTAEIKAVQPQAIVCLGNTAARALISPGFVMKEGRGRWLGETPAMRATYHPASILRARGDQRDEQYRQLHEDLAEAARYITKIAA